MIIAEITMSIRKLAMRDSNGSNDGRILMTNKHNTMTNTKSMLRAQTLFQIVALSNEPLSWGFGALPAPIVVPPPGRLIPAGEGVGVVGGTGGCGGEALNDLLPQEGQIRILTITCMPHELQ